MEMYSNNNDLRELGLHLRAHRLRCDVATNYDNSLGNLSQASYIPNPGNGTNLRRRHAAGSAVHRHRRRRGRTERRQPPGAGDQRPRQFAMAIRQHQLVHRRSRTAASRSRSSIPTICRSGHSWYDGHIAPIQSDIGPALQACASPGLFYDAAIGSDLGQALAALFAAVTKSGHLTQ